MLRRGAARGARGDRSSVVPRPQCRAEEVLKDIEAEVARAEPVVIVAGAAQGHGTERVVLSKLPRRDKWVGKAVPGRALVAPPTSREPALAARKGMDGREREVFRDKHIASGRVADPVPPRRELFLGLRHRWHAAVFGRGGAQSQPS